MAYGQLTEDQEKALTPYLNVPVIMDLGCGNLELAYRLVKLGASSVIGIDKARATPDKRYPEVVFVQTEFRYWPLKIHTAFVSWPHNILDEYLLHIVQNTSVVMYLGSNIEGSACGDPTLFKHLCSREVLVHVPDPQNSLIVYGSRLKEPRRHLPEEFAGIKQDKIWHYAELLERPLPYAAY